MLNRAAAIAGICMNNLGTHCQVIKGVLIPLLRFRSEGTSILPLKEKEKLFRVMRLHQVLPTYGVHSHSHSHPFRIVPGRPWAVLALGLKQNLALGAEHFMSFWTEPCTCRYVSDTKPWAWVTGHLQDAFIGGLHISKYSVK